MQRTVLPALRVLFLGAIVLSVVPYGAVQPYWFHASVLLISLTLALSMAVAWHGDMLRRIHAVAFVAVLLICLALAAQSISFAGNPFAHPGWAMADELIGVQRRSISIDPATTLWSIPKVAAPFFVFMSVLVLFQDDVAAERLWRWLAWFGFAVAAFGLVQFTAFPGTLLLGPKVYQRDSLTATFVNPNTAATFLGLSALLVLGVVARQLMRVEIGRLLVAPGKWMRSEDYRWLLIYSAMLLTVLVALFLTRSRGGVSSSFAAVLLAAVVLAFAWRSKRASPLLRLAFGTGVAASVAMFFVIYAGRTIRRAEQQGLEDGRWCAFDSTLRAIGDYPIFGTGFGTFDQVFPAYRDVECAGISGGWYRAHNSILEGYLGLGIPFALLLVAVVAVLIWIYLRGYRDRQRYRFAPVICISALLLVLLHSVVDFSLQIHGVAVMTAAVLGAGAVISLNRIQRYRR